MKFCSHENFIEISSKFSLKLYWKFHSISTKSRPK